MPLNRPTCPAVARRLMLGVALATLPLPALAEDGATIDEIVVTGAGEATGPGEGYVAETTTSGSKTPTPIKDIPQSISVVTRQQMDDRRPAQLEDTLAYTPGVFASNWGVDDRFDQFMIRGFDIGTSGIFRDGLSQKVIDFSAFKIEPYSIDRIEVIKGPAGVLYGENDVGGMVNAITKRPTFDRFAEVFASYGSFNTKETGFDVGGALAKDSDWAFRLTGLARDGSTEVKDSQNDRLFIAPALTWQPDSKTHLTILANFQRDRLTPNSFMPVAGIDYDAALGQLPDSFLDSQSDFNRFDTTAGSIGYEFETGFDNGITLRQNLRYSAQSVDYKHLYFNGMTDSTTMNFAAFTVDETAQVFNVDNQAQYKFDVGSVENTVLAGFDYSRYYLDGKNGYDASYNISILDPSYDFAVTSPAIYSDGTQTIDRLGLYVQEQAKIADHWNLTLGLRQSWIANSSYSRLDGSSSDQRDQALTSMIGLGYDFDNGITPYVSYSEAFITNTGTTFGGDLFKPSKGRQYEIGVKYKPDGFNGFFTAALFDITKTNVLTTDPDNPFYSVQTGEVNHRGLELEGNFDLGAGLSMTAGYTYLHAEITRSNDGDVGNRPALAPEHQASVWANYKVQSGVLEGVSVGAGVRYIGQTFGDNANTLSVDGHALVDAAIRYGRDNYEAALNVSNLLDKDYYATCYPSAGCIAGEGRVITGTLTAKF